jgi:hypothetical protein
MDKVADALNPIPNRKWFMLEKLRGLLALLNQVLTGKLAKCLSGLLGLTHIELNHPAGDLSDLCNRFTSIEMDHIECVQGVVGFAPTQWLNS